ncbi:MAG: DUF6259 domain-containing protein [Chthonomonadales bacterium]
MAGFLLIAGLASVLLCAVSGAQGDPLVVVLRGARRESMVVSQVHVPRRLLGDCLVGAAQNADGAVPFQIVPDAVQSARGIAVMRAPVSGDISLTLASTQFQRPRRITAPCEVVVGSSLVQMDPSRMAGFPNSIRLGDGKTLSSFTWNDRLYRPGAGGFLLRNDRNATLELLCEGPLCSVYRVRAAYCDEDGRRAPGNADAVYDWYFFRDAPIAFVTGIVRQAAPEAWSELHFLEWNFSGNDFARYAGGNPVEEGALDGRRESRLFSSWAALTAGNHAVGMFGGLIRMYDGRGEYGTYLHAAWTSFQGGEARFSAWLWMGEAPDPVARIRHAADALSAQPRVAISTRAVHRAVQLSEQAAERATGTARLMRGWMSALARQAELEGSLEDARTLASGAVPQGWRLVRAGDLGIAFSSGGGSIRLHSVYDLRRRLELAASEQPPLFALTIRQNKTGPDINVTADAGWSSTQITKAGNDWVLRWKGLRFPDLPKFSVIARLTPDAAANRVDWTFHVETPPGGPSIWRVDFPQIGVADLGSNGAVLYPAGPGVEHTDPWNHPLTYLGQYPGGWCSMPLLAAYRKGPDAAGLYFAVHDAWGSIKDVSAQSDAASRAVILSYHTPAPNRGVPGNGYTQSGKAVWALLRGDWFDAAQMYRHWVMRHARWWPKIGHAGRPDTPLWMRRLAVWAVGGGAPSECVPLVKRFAQAMGTPTGFHWYNWHSNPFDNDYPHYFPTKPGVAEGVKELQRAGVKVMPYINGRLWDTRDRGLEDWEFTSRALPAACKDAAGKPIIESYGSKESDGSPVRLAVMCPTTHLWQSVIADLVSRLFQEVGVDGVYIDQVAAAYPALCMDPTHGHPLGGGHWWNEGYWKLVGAIKAAKPKDRMLTTECNAEPFINVFDGYLTWHWQMNGMVPAFPAVYGGAIQMFGRNYAGGPQKDLALRMKAGQQLVFGEQIGWINPAVVDEPENIAFLKQIVAMRRKLAPWFYAGRMLRPPSIEGQTTTVTADWQWGGVAMVTTPQVLTGAWKRLDGTSIALIFVNVGDEPAQVAFRANWSEYGLPRRFLFNEVGQGSAVELRSRALQHLVIPARAVRAFIAQAPSH